MPNRFAATVIVMELFVCSCTAPVKKDAVAIAGGDPDRGASSISKYGCGACHMIPGIAGAHGQVGPSLAGIGNRVYVANLPNEPANLMRWILNPRSINEKTAMPNVGVTRRDAGDIAAYLYSLK